MILSIMGIEGYLQFKCGETILLGIENQKLFSKLAYELQGYSNLDNDFVILGEEDQRLDKELLYIPDLVSYEIDNKAVLDRLIKKKLISNELLIEDQVYHNRIYSQLISSVIHEVDLLEVDYNYRMEYDIKNVAKLLSLDFSPINALSPLEKTEEIIRIYSTLFEQKIFLIKNGLQNICSQDLENLSNFVENNQVNLIFYEHLKESEVVIANNLFITDDLSAYKVKTTEKNMI